MTVEKRFALVRILFGVVWAFDAYFKWQPAFLHGLIDLLTEVQKGQPLFEHLWIGWWIYFLQLAPYFFAVGIALIETGIAIGLLVGFFTRTVLVVTIIFSFLIWSVGQGFGGPYGFDSTDVDSGIVYLLLACTLFIGSAWRAYSVDSWLDKRSSTQL